MHKYFTKLNHKLSNEFTSSALLYAEKVEAWEKRFYFDRTGLPYEIAILDPVVLKVINKYNSIIRSSIFRFTPYKSWTWHIDQSRNCSVNILLNGFGSSITLHGEQEEKTPVYRNISKLEYQPSAMYAFNTSELHCVTNFEETRYLISLGIPPPTTYNDLVLYLKSNGYIDEE